MLFAGKSGTRWDGGTSTVWELQLGGAPAVSSDVTSLVLYALLPASCYVKSKLKSSWINISVK
jgi:hypothetical protein